MSEPVVIRSNRDDGGELRLSPLDRYTILAEFTGPVVNASVRVAALSSSDLLPYFDDLARHWDGWKGAKTWESLEGQMKLECTRDALGHLFLRVTLRDSLGGAEWLAGGIIQLAAGELEQLAKSARRVFAAQAHAV